jgi:hypothetical protein
LDLPEPLQMQFKSYQTDFDRAKDEHLRSREAMARVLEAGGRSEEAAHFRTAIAHLTNEFYAKSSLLYTSDDKLGAPATLRSLHPDLSTGARDHRLDNRWSRGYRACR